MAKEIKMKMFKEQEGNLPFLGSVDMTEEEYRKSTEQILQPMLTFATSGCYEEFRCAANEDLFVQIPDESEATCTDTVRAVTEITQEAEWLFLDVTFVTSDGTEISSFKGAMEL